MPFARRLASSRSLGAFVVAACLLGLLAAPTAAAGTPLPGAGDAALISRDGAPRLGETLADEAADEDAKDPQAPIATVQIAPEAPELPVAADSYLFNVLVTNPGEQELPGGTLRLSMNAELLSDPDALAEFLRGESAESADVEDPSDEAANADATAVIAEVEVGATEPNGAQEFAIEVDSASLPLSAVSTPGVYGFSARLALEPSDGEPEQDPASTAPEEVDAASGSLTASTTAVWRGSALDQSSPLALVIPLVLPNDVQSMPNRDALGEAAPRLDALLTSAEEWQATLAIDPRIIAGIRAFGEAAPQPATDFLERLERTSLPSFLLQFADADPAVQAALGFDELLQPVGLSYISRSGSFPAPESGAEAPSPEQGSGGTETDATSSDETSNATGDEPADQGDDETSADELSNESADEGTEVNPLAPSLDDLLAWPGGTPTAWPADGQADDATLRLLRASGIERLVLDGGNVTAADSARATVDGFDTLVSDSHLAEAAARALAASTETARAAAITEIGSILAVHAQPLADENAAGPTSTGASPDAILLALDRGGLADAESPAALLDALAELDWVHPVGVDSIPAGTAEFASGHSPELRTRLLTETIDRSERIDALAPLLEQPGYLVQYQRVRLLNALATKHAAPAVDYEAVDRRIRQRDAALLSGVEIVQSDNTQLVGTSSNVPVLVHNALPFDAEFTLQAAPTSAAVIVSENRFTGERVVAEGNTTVLVPVRSRVSSGVTGLMVEISDAEDDSVYSSSILRLTIRASYETILLIALGALTAALLGIGVWRSILRRRRAVPAEE